jgi:hypothetical protein
MATVREWVIQQASAGEHAINARRLFLCFSAHARKNYSYSAVKITGNEGSTLLDRDVNENVTVDCASLADALVELINEQLKDEKAETVSEAHGMGFATKQRSDCFDQQVKGNIRTPGGTYAETGRCVFSSHYFVSTGAQTRMLFDPCMFTAYSTRSEVKNWTFEDAGGPFYHKVKFINQSRTQVLVRIPDGHPAPAPPGFSGGWVLFNSASFKSDDLKAFKGKRTSNWSDEKYARKADAACARINKLLSEQAGVQTAMVI